MGGKTTNSRPALNGTTAYAIKVTPWSAVGVFGRRHRVPLSRHVLSLGSMCFPSVQYHLMLLRRNAHVVELLGHE